jgi:hypothetical protein
MAAAPQATGAVFKSQASAFKGCLARGV